MFKRLTAVGTAPVLIVIFMLFLVHLQPLDRMGLISAEGARTGRLVLDLLPYGLAVLGLGIGFRFRSCGVMIAMLALASAYLALKLDGDGGTGSAVLHRDLRHTLPTLLATTGLLAAWAENVSWRTRRGCWALLLSLAVLFVFWGDKLHLFGMQHWLGAWFAFLGQQLNAILGPLLAVLAEGSGISIPLSIEFGAVRGSAAGRSDPQPPSGRPGGKPCDNRASDGPLGGEPSLGIDLYGRCADDSGGHIGVGP